ncbi:EAL domain-containing protein [Sphingorhabdus sp.]|uniref:EAL domain-containing protein n=1 Tax=Sphingorhabdus sp. TaxID=1902408 RepID=UPI0035947CDA
MSYYSGITGRKSPSFASDVKNENVDFVYQPVICKRTKEILYHEQLSRFRNTMGRLRSTQTIIAWFEVTGEILDLDIRSFEAAISALSEHENFNIGVNISGATLSNKAACDKIVQYLMAAPDICPRLYVEVTETHSISNMLFAAEFAAALDGMGVQMVVDDFGEGNSTALYLSVLIPAVVKLRMISGKIPDAELIEKAVLARTYGAALVVEGVETAEDILAFPKALVDFYQGYFYGEPAPLEHWQKQARRPELRLVSTEIGFK